MIIIKPFHIPFSFSNDCIRVGVHHMAYAEVVVMQVGHNDSLNTCPNAVLGNIREYLFLHSDGRFTG